MTLRRTRARVITVTAAVLSTVFLVAVGVAFAEPGGKGSGTPGDPADRQAYESAVATSQASQKPQLEFLKSFENSGQDPGKLPTVELAASSTPPEPIAVVANRSDVITVVEVVGVRYFGSNLGDLPATEVTYRALETHKGSTIGDFKVSLAGGPYRQPDGTVVAIVLPYTNVESLGTRSLAFLTLDANGMWKPTSAGSVFRLSPDGSIAVAPNASRAGIAGKSVAAAVAEGRVP